jgi:hypothetical protein
MMQTQSGNRPSRRHDDYAIPTWAVEIKDDLSDMRSDFGSRLARLEAGVVLVGFLIMAVIGILSAAHIF